MENFIFWKFGKVLFLDESFSAFQLTFYSSGLKKLPFTILPMTISYQPGGDGY